jgi:type I restriction enzyme S subunit
LNVKSTGDYWRMELMSRKMKGSGIEWIGEIPEEWKICKIKYLVTVVMGQSPSSDNYNLEGIGEPFLQGNADFADKYPIERVYTCEASKFADIGDILLSVRAPVGAKNIANKKYAIGRGLCALRTQSINKDLLWYLIDIMNKEFEINSKGSTYDSVTVSDVNNASIVIGPIDDQARITTSLNSKCTQIDETIEKQKQVIEKLKEYRESIITEAVTKGLNHNVPMKDSGIEWIGEIPKHWTCRKLKTISSTISKGTTPSTIGKDLIEEGKIRFLKAENIKNNIVVSEPEFFIDEETNEIISRSKLLENDILFVIAGATIGKVAILSKNLTPANTNQAISFIRLHTHESYKYVWYFLQSNYVKENINVLAVQSAQPNLSMEDLGNFSLTCPSTSEQNIIADYLDNKCSKIDEAIAKKESLIEKLTEYKKSLIYECVTGKKEINIV